MSRIDGRVFYCFFFLLSYLTPTMAVEVKTILALLAFFLFRKAIVKARCRRLERLRMLVMSRQRRLRSFLASLVNNAAATNALDSTTYLQSN